MNIELYMQLKKINEIYENIRPYYIQEECSHSSGKKILCIDYREKHNVTWIDKLKQKMPNNTYYTIFATKSAMTNGLILNAINDISKKHYFDILCINFNSIINAEHLVQHTREPFCFKYKKCKVFSTSLNLSCYYYCIFAFIKIVTFIEMLSVKKNICLIWHGHDFKLLKFILFRYLNECFFVGKSILNRYSTDACEKEQYEIQLFNLFYNKIKQLKD